MRSYPEYSDSLSPILPFSLSRSVRLGALSVLVAILVAAQSLGAAQLSANQILDRAGKNYDVVNDYIVDAKLTVESPQMHVPDMQIKIYYKKPNKLHVDSKDGFAMLPKQGTLVGNPLKDMQAHSRLAVAPSQKVLGEDCYVVKGTFKNDGRETESTVWIDKKNFLIRQMSANPEWGPSIRAKIWYMRVANQYWLPRMTSATISIPPLPEERVDAKRTQGGPTNVMLKFANYRVNTGLNDKIFQKREGGK